MDKQYFERNLEEKFYCPVSGELLTAKEWLEIQKDLQAYDPDMFPDSDFEGLISEEDYTEIF